MCISGNSDGSDNDSGSRLRQQRSGGQNTADSAERVPIRWLTTGDAAAEAIQDNDRIISDQRKVGIDLTVEIVPEANTEKVNVAMASAISRCGNRHTGRAQPSSGLMMNGYSAE
ncbi:MAG: hypothetical protein ACLURV_08905 [Gallintestinimicrobium sp.]